MDEKLQTADVGAGGQQKLSDEMRTLRYWLATEDVYMSGYVRKWLERTPTDEADDVLARIAASAQPEPHSLWHMLFRGFMMVFTTSEAVTETNPAGRKAGTRAALLLANRKDARCLAPLARVYETAGFWEGKYQEDIEAALLHFLTSNTDSAAVRQNVETLRSLAERIWESVSGRRELSSQRAGLLIVMLRSLAGPGGEPELTLLKSIAAAQATTPNRARVKEAAVRELAANERG